ncbi:hypothetical protein [Bacillus solitudinis]|uniref:hypothetical protein n=1 Tax=Bacillus solitudinis TaxID=2014074 RepID=UPI000C24F527|nr:hypothetical protein [Bacillus solitudinis]
MNIQGYDYQNEYRNTGALHEQCKNYMSHHVTLTMKDGSAVDGIIENVGTDGINVLVGEDVMERSEQDERYYGGYGYGYPRRRFRRFRRQFFPLATLAALSLFPYLYPAPYPYPYPYPYY